MSGDSFTFEPYPSAGPTGPPPPATRTGDVVLTVILLVLLALGALLVTALAALVGFLVESTEDGDGDSGPLMAFVLLPTWGLWLVALVVSVWLMARKRLAFWVPMVAFGVWAVLVLVVVNV